MNLTIASKLRLAFGVVALMLLGSGGLIWLIKDEAARHFDTLTEATADTAALADAQSALWALHWGVAQYMAVYDPAVRSKIASDSGKQRQEVERALERIARGGADLDAGQRKALEALRENFARYAGSRDKWMTLMNESRIDEAAQERAQNTTPAGAATVKAFATLIELQRKAGQEASQSAQVGTARLSHLALAIMTACIVLALVAMVWIVRTVTGSLHQAVGTAQSIAAGDLSQPITHDRHDEVGHLIAALATMQDALTETIARIRNNAESVANVSMQIAQGNQDLSSRTEAQASSLQQTAATMEQLGTTVRQNAGNAQQANQLALGASAVAVKGGEVVGQVVETMKGISTSSKKIADIISVIDGIAFQTNILALNAAVEAARAGEQGRGFAVVAGEVRTLAQRSAEAAKEIKSLITASVERVDQGAALVDQAGQTMDEVVASIRRVTDIVGEISAASVEQDSGVQQVVQAIGQMDQVTQQNTALVEESAAAAENLRNQAGVLVQAVGVFKLAQGTRGIGTVPVAADTLRRDPAPATSTARPASGKPADAQAGTLAEWSNF